MCYAKPTTTATTQFRTVRAHTAPTSKIVSVTLRKIRSLLTSTLTITLARHSRTSTPLTRSEAGSVERQSLLLLRPVPTTVLHAPRTTRRLPPSMGQSSLQTTKTFAVTPISRPSPLPQRIRSEQLRRLRAPTTSTRTLALNSTHRPLSRRPTTAAKQSKTKIETSELKVSQLLWARCTHPPSSSTRCGLSTTTRR